ncbi:MAG: 30S ribosomal protein S8e [Nanoarchaeota archaeon]|nr:30S ribosomal protein S8e [Nanoarchaeota archaeon]MBU1031225.1 30S ribosomal protein S8e [Nanoarchaeota archaeon]MBU1849219.1 30S ribosomal protein S8e [Nanoarchaeota archaeon]
MVLTQDRSKRKLSGGRYTVQRLKRKFRMGRTPILTTIGKTKAKSVRCAGGNIKRKLQHAEKVNVFNPKTKKSSVETIKTVLESPANRHFVRRNIITKGAVIETSKGKAKIMNRPSQEGSINAILLE